MIQILPVRDAALLAQLNEKESTAAGFGYCYYEGGEICGHILYDLNKDEGIIRLVNAPDDSIADGLVRAVFASLYDFGLDKARFHSDVNPQQLVRLGFVQAGSCETTSLQSVLYHCKSCDGKSCHCENGNSENSNCKKVGGENCKK